MDAKVPTKAVLAPSAARFVCCSPDRSASMARNKEKKRSHAQYARDLKPSEDASSGSGVAETLARLREPGQAADEAENGRHGEWTTVERRKKSKRNPSEGGEEDTERLSDVRSREQSNGKNKDNRPALTFAAYHKIQSSLRINDLQGLVLYCLADGVSPQWISVRHHNQVRKALVLLVPGLEWEMFDGQMNLSESTLGNTNDHPVPAPASPDGASTDALPQFVSSKSRNGVESPDDYLPVPLSSTKLAEPLKPLAEIFERIWPVKAPGDDRYYKVHSPIHAMLNAPIPKSKEEKAAEKALKGPKPLREGKDWKNKRTPITGFIASNEELQENDYTLHPVCFSTELEKEKDLARRKSAKMDAEHGWKESNIKQLGDGNVPESDVEQGSVTAGRTVLAMDCEMCKVQGGDMALTRISLVGWDGNVVMDELVKPDLPIVDYLTQYSGITAKKLDPISTTLSDIQNRLLDILTPKTILIGHSLNADLDALKLTHPFIVDTSVLYQHPRGPPMKSSLKWLAQKYLNREIQKGHGMQDHDSIEDAKACLDLVKVKCEKGAAWGSVESTTETIFKRLSRTYKPGTANSQGKNGAIVDSASPGRSFGGMASVCLEGSNDEEVVAGVKRAVLGDPDGSIVPGGGVDFTWARLRELENYRGWSNENRLARETPQVRADNTASMSTDLTSSSIKEPPISALSTTVAQTVKLITAIREFLPPCTLFIVYSGTGDPRRMAQLQDMQKTFKTEYKRLKWDQLSVKWTDKEEQALKAACQKARKGIGLMTVT